MTDYETFLVENGLTQQAMDEAKAQCNDFVPMPKDAKVCVAWSAIEGVGVRSLSGFETGDTVAPAKIAQRWTAAGRFTNHDANANVEMRNGNFIAVRPIRLGEEITVNYRQVKEALV